MSEGGFKLKFGWLDKLKKIKHIEIYVLVLFVAIVGLIFFSTNKSSNASSTETQNSVTAYISSVETRLEKILNRIDGVSNVSVMISLNLNDIGINNSNLEISNFPSIKGVIITAKGVDSTYNKMQILHAIETVLDVKNNNVQIFLSN